MIADRVRMRKSKKGIPSYIILTDDTIIGFEIENTPIANFCNQTESLVINGVSYTKNAIKEIHFEIESSYSGVTSIGKFFLAGCSSLTDITLDFPVLEYVGDRFLYYCSSLTNLTLDFPVLNSVGSTFLHYCLSLIDVTLDFPVLNSVGDNFIERCPSLTNLTLDFPVLQYVGYYFLYLSTSLTNLTLTTVYPPNTGVTGFLYGTYSLTSIYVPANSVNYYLTVVPWNSIESWRFKALQHK